MDNGDRETMKECHFPFEYGEEKGEVCDYDCTYCEYYYERPKERLNTSECV